MISSRKSGLRHLLQEPAQRGYPSDYLISRLKGRRADFIRDYKPVLLSDSPSRELSDTVYNDFIVIHSDEGPRRRLQSEYRWVYLQMNDALRKTFRPYFLYHELRTISICLRYKRKPGREEDIKNHLSESLLSDEVKDALTLSPDLPAAISGVSELFSKLLDNFQKVEDSFSREGLKDAEAVLAGTFLEHMAGTERDDTLRRFFMYIIDSRNILALYKRKRWQVEGLLPPIKGGSLNEALYDKKETDIVSLVNNIAGSHITEATSTQIETALMIGLNRLTRKMARKPSDNGLILNYLHSCWLEAMNLSLILYGGRLDRESLEDELVVL